MATLGRILGQTLRQHEAPGHLHAAFRFPARLHHRVSRSIIEHYSRPGALVCDPFVGCGTNQLEAAVLNRNSLGLDVDPLATFVSSAKLGILGVSESAIEKYVNRLLGRTEHFRYRRDYDALMFSDISKLNGAAHRAGLSDDAKDLLENWFRKYVIEDLATIIYEIRASRADARLKALAFLAFASAVRTCSKADPVPVSGLEYTKRMRELDRRGRRIDPFAIYERRLTLIATQAIEFVKLTSARPTTHDTLRHDATMSWPTTEIFDLIAFSPPYLSAVEYSRRHKLEMAWLSLFDSHEHFIGIANQYIGHRAIGSTTLEDERWDDRYLDRVRKQLLSIDYKRARAFAKYCRQMSSVLSHAAQRMDHQSSLVVVIGDNTTAGVRISSDRMMRALAEPELRLVEQHSYSLRNRYMTYSRRNDADIDSERILVFRRKIRQ